MSQNTQNVRYLTIASGASRTFRQNELRSIFVAAVDDSCTIGNGDESTTLPSGGSLGIDADAGNTLNQVVITAGASGTVSVIYY